MPNPRTKPNLLIIDDDEEISGLLEIAAQGLGWRPVTAGTMRRGLQRLSGQIKAVILDHGLPDGDGLQALQLIRERNPEVAVVMLTGLNDAETAVKALRCGADDYLTKPFEIERLFKVLQEACRQHRQPVLRQESGMESEMLLQTKSPAMRAMIRNLERVARLDMTVLVTGESGTGKSWVAREVHRMSPRSKDAFVVVSCPALPRQLLESELFGHEEGAFTGGTTARKGHLEEANRGSILLDEVADLPMPIQLKLVTLLQNRRYFRLGGTKPQTSDARIIATTHADLGGRVRAGQFREDLLYRLNIFEVRVPPLRQRMEDLPQLCEQILIRISERRGGAGWELSQDALASLACQSWPGNIRQLENVLERASAYADGPMIRLETVQPLLDAPAPELVKAPRSLLDMERQAFIDAYVRNGRNKARTARELGISERTVYNLLKRYQVP